MIGWLRRAAVMLRRTPTAQPHASWWFLSRVAGVPVTQDSALQVSAVWACVRVIAETIAALPCRVHVFLPAGRKAVAFRHPADRLLHTAASPEMDAFAFRQTLFAHCLTWGNGYAEIERRRDGRPAALWLLTPDTVRPFRAQGGEVVADAESERAAVAGEILYEVGGRTNLPAANVLHLKGLGFDGLVGYSVIAMAARTIGLSLALDKDGTEFFENAARPSGVLEVPGAVSTDAKRQTIADWTAAHTGANAYKIAVLDRGAKFNAISLPNKDSQWLEARQWQVTDICRWFRVPPHKIGDLSRATFSNIEHQAIEFVQDTILPWAVRWESECAAKLLLPSESTYFVKLNLRGLLRGDLAGQAAFYEAMSRIGVFSVNDILRLEDMDPIGPEGDKRLVQLNLTTLDAVGVAPLGGTPDVGDGNTLTGGADTGGVAAAVVAGMRPVVADCLDRILRREEKAIAGKQPDDEFLARHEEFVRGALMCVASAVADAGLADRDVLAAVVTAYAQRHVTETKAAAAAGAAVRSEERAVAAARWIVDRVSIAVRGTAYGGSP